MSNEALILELRAQIRDLELAEEGAKEAFGHVVQQKRELEKECGRLRELLDGAYASIRRMSHEGKIVTHQEAKEVLEQAAGKQPQFSRDMDTVILDGEYTIEELHAMLQLMEYNT